MADELDAFLGGVVVSLHRAADLGIRSASADPATAERTLQDCKDILELILHGRVQEWIAE